MMKKINLLFSLTACFSLLCCSKNDEYQLNKEEWNNAFALNSLLNIKVDVIDEQDDVKTSHMVLVSDKVCSSQESQLYQMFDSEETLKDEYYYQMNTTNDYYEIYPSNDGYVGVLKEGNLTSTQTYTNLSTIESLYSPYFSSMEYRGNGVYYFSYGTFILSIRFDSLKRLNEIDTTSVVNKIKIREVYSFNHEYRLNVPDFKKM